MHVHVHDFDQSLVINDYYYGVRFHPLAPWHGTDIGYQMSPLAPLWSQHTCTLQTNKTSLASHQGLSRSSLFIFLVTCNEWEMGNDYGGSLCRNVIPQQNPDICIAISSVSCHSSMFLLLHRSYQQVPLWWWVAVLGLVSSLSAILPDGEGPVLPPLLPRPPLLHHVGW